MSLTIEQLTTPVTHEQTLETFLSILETLGLPARSWRKGGVARSILSVVAKTYAGFSELMASAIKAGFLETAESDWLTQLAYNVYGVTRTEATFATGQVTVTNGGGGVYTFGAEEFLVKNIDGKVFANTAAFSLNPTDVLTIAIRAVEVGADSSSAVGAVNALVTHLDGVTVTNAAAVVGTDAESDDELKTKCRNKLSALSMRGPRGAYEYAVTTATRPDTSPVNINRHAVSPSSSTGTVTVYCAAPSGAPDPLDLGYVRDRIEEVARPDSVTVTVLAATEVPIARDLTIWAKRTNGVSSDDIKDMVEDALLAAVTEYDIGGIPKPPSSQGYLYADFLAGIAKSAHSSIFDIDGTGADIALNPGQVAILTATVSVRIV